jgi:hypothetical protein
LGEGYRRPAQCEFRPFGRYLYQVWGFGTMKESNALVSSAPNGPLGGCFGACPGGPAPPPGPVARMTGTLHVGARKTRPCGLRSSFSIWSASNLPTTFPVPLSAPLPPRRAARLSVELDSSAWASAGLVFPSLVALGRPLVWPKPHLRLPLGSRRFDRLVFVRLCAPSSLAEASPVFARRRPPIWPALPPFALGPLWSGRSLAFARLGFPLTRPIPCLCSPLVRSGLAGASPLLASGSLRLGMMPHLCWPVESKTDLCKHASAHGSGS